MFNHIDHGVELPKLTRKTTETGRKYFTPEGNSYPSITTVLSILNKDSIIKWRKRVGEVEANKITTQAAARGTAVHKLAEDYIDNVPNYDEGYMPHHKYSFSHLKDILDNHLDNIWLQESFLYSDRLKCAGQVDCIGEWDGVLSIVDFKTSRKPKKVEWITNYFIQSSFYAAAFYERTGIAITQAVIPITVDHNEPQVFKVNTHDYLPLFLDARQKYREQKENG